MRLPTTDFSLRANSVVREPEIQKFWSEQQVYESLVQNNPGVSCVLVWVLWFVRIPREGREHSLGISTRQLQKCTSQGAA